MGNFELKSGVAEVIKHSHYNPATIDNDYAILVLSQPVSFTDEVSPACLPDNWENTYDGVSATVTGWGKTSSGSVVVAATLQEADVMVKSDAECHNVFPVPFTKNMICTGGTGKGICDGDSGGPLAVRENGRHAVVCTIVQLLSVKNAAQT